MPKYVGCHGIIMALELDGIWTYRRDVRQKDDIVEGDPEFRLEENAR